MDEVRSGGYHISQSDFRVHFGLGGASKLDIEIRWPGGDKDSYRDLDANRWIVIRRGKGVEASHEFVKTPSG